LLADQPFQRRDPGFILLKKIRRGCVFVKDAGLVLLDPNSDQVSTDVVALGEPMKGLAGQEFLSNLALEFDAVRAVLGHGLPSFESPARWSILAGPTVRPKGPTPIEGQSSTPIDTQDLCLLHKAQEPCAVDGFVNDLDAVFEAKFMLPWSFSEEAAAEKHMAQLQHNMWVTNARSAVLSIITGGGKWIEMTIPADALYQHFLVTAERRFWRCVQTG
jgi:hypothetical protein